MNPHSSCQKLAHQIAWNLIRSTPHTLHHVPRPNAIPMLVSFRFETQIAQLFLFIVVHAAFRFSFKSPSSSYIVASMHRKHQGKSGRWFDRNQCSNCAEAEFQTSPTSSTIPHNSFSSLPPSLHTRSRPLHNFQFEVKGSSIATYLRVANPATTGNIAPPSTQSHLNLRTDEDGTDSTVASARTCRAICTCCSCHCGSAISTLCS